MFAPFAVYADNKYLTGEHIEPAYEGWRENPDGTFTLIFGYMNENWKEELDVPVGGRKFLFSGRVRPRPANAFFAAWGTGKLTLNLPVFSS